MAVFTNEKRKFDIGSRKANVVVRTVRDMRLWHTLMRPLHAASSLLRPVVESVSGQAALSLAGSLSDTAGPLAARRERIRSRYCRRQS